MKTADMEVTLVDHMGSDLSVVNAARVSFDKISDWEYVEEDVSVDCHPTTLRRKVLSKKDTKLIQYLAKHNHWTPFGHAYLSFRIKAPVFVARQLVKHQVGLVWNEESRRYIDNEPEFYIPKEWRAKADNVKQGSSDTLVEELSHEDGRSDLWGPFDNRWHPTLHVDYSMYMQLEMYKWLLQSNVAPEQARMVLPQNTMTNWIWSGSLMAFSRVCKLRLDHHAQLETRVIAEKIADNTKSLFPVSWQALMEN